MAWLHVEYVVEVTRRSPALPALPVVPARLLVAVAMLALALALALALTSYARHIWRSRLGLGLDVWTWQAGGVWMGWVGGCVCRMRWMGECLLREERGGVGLSWVGLGGLGGGMKREECSV
ncbi:uncharacterized protein K452DRAFT_85348 [Aplosporella prunicola CBS 121167]|uniref:Uncharacterized protein n=1 Tax=Aplosporella prunicola CBS 121167 TaxID=1176127 RepID=A0A6A6B471_9PEZI|nr:uncharacterized protein K452DRAFT_85348 [Aplosporella prunicola CBS 121167]KAF2138860.1 hypothetical protein K452DRAFT_85348 [Aplosporella prunicola CBS 121167]